jgi:hypothetical protein
LIAADAEHNPNDAALENIVTALLGPSFAFVPRAFSFSPLPFLNIVKPLIPFVHPTFLLILISFS